MNKELLARRFSKAAATYDQSALAQQEIASHLWSITSRLLTDTPKRILEIGCGTGMLTRIYTKECIESNVTLNDIYDSRDFLPPIYSKFIQGDAEEVDLGDGYDLILSTSALQWFSDLSTFINKIEQSLKPGGVFAFSTFGPYNYNEMRSVTNSGLDYHTQEELMGMLDRFDVIRFEERTITHLFGSPIDILRHIKSTGVAGGLGSSWSKGQLTRFVKDYGELSNENGDHPLTYHPYWVVVRKKYEGK
ncbi:MAG: malonyl-ACP O-methyltransferase BioC [Bacteroidales bacterium]